jgi:DNA helicase-4
MSDGREQLFTAPFVDRDSYLASMEWKRKVHAKYGTTLIETYSYERQEGRLLASLAEKLTPYETLMPLAPDTIYDRVIELKLVDDVSKLLGTFLRKFKSGAYSLEECEAKSERMNLGQRAKAFLDIFVPVFDEYQRRLGGRIDFEDMILRAARHVETGRYASPFRHILVDEFQDISQSRAVAGVESPTSGCANLRCWRRLAVYLPLCRIRHSPHAPFRARIRRQFRWRDGSAQDHRSWPYLPVG